jgi:hypothetical protein
LEHVVHQDAVVDSKEAGKDAIGNLHVGVDAAEKCTSGWEPALLEVRERESGVFENRKGNSGVELGPVEGKLEEDAELGVRPDVLEELKSPTNALLVTQVAIADAEEPSGTKDHGSGCFGTAASLREADQRHFLLDVVQLSLCHVTAGETVGHAW